MPQVVATNLTPFGPDTFSLPKPATALQNASVKINGKVWSREELQKAYDEAIQRLLREKAAQWEIWKYDMWGAYYPTSQYVTTQESLMEQAKLLLGLDADGGLPSQNWLFRRLEESALNYMHGDYSTRFAAVKFVALDGTEKIALFQFTSPNLWTLKTWHLVKVIDAAEMTATQAATEAMIAHQGGVTEDAERIAFMIDIVQMGLDIAGIFDPTPISDVSSGLIALLKGDPLSAGISVVSVVPYVGDITKIKKVKEWLEIISKIISALDKGGERSRALAVALKPFADKMWELLHRVDWKAIADQFPTVLAVRDKLFQLIHKIDSLTNVVRKAENHAVDTWALYRTLGCFVAGTPVRIAMATGTLGEYEAFAWEWDQTEQAVCAAVCALMPQTAATGEGLLAIEQVPFGSRVLARNPRSEDFDFSFPEPNQSDWRKLTLQVERTDGALIRIEALRPHDCIQRLNLRVGRLTAIEYPELQLAGFAEVLAIEDSPPIDDGPGSVVIARVVTSNANQLIRATFADGEELVGTDQHPIWNVLAQDWTPLGKLVPGDYVLAEGQPLAVISVTRLTVDEPVYNLEVHGERVYEAGKSGVLVHNTTAAAQCKEFLDQLGKLEAKGNLAAAEALVKGRVEEIVKRAGSLTADEQKQLAMLADKYASEALDLLPYNIGKGHHAPAKSGMRGADGYNWKTELTIPDEVLKALEIDHDTVSGAQKSLYQAFKKTRKTLTFEIMLEIETQALIRGGADPIVALATVKKMIDSLKARGFKNPFRIPWGGK